ncbi:MAG: low molecular weight phosphotyrosine protein phosphatase [Proteobacteria bacterium]|nr:low molecular weight phosphotyrosine protein phosphatase [Pseudomonadota bacterium]
MGNICRSPVAEAIARAEFSRAGIIADIASAGTERFHVGDPADPRSVASARRHGYDLGRHRAQLATPVLLRGFDTVLAMDHGNLDELARTCPGNPAQLFLPFAGISSPREVPDPYHGGADDFERVVELVRAGVERMIERLAMAHNAGMQATGSSA